MLALGGYSVEPIWKSPMTRRTHLPMFVLWCAILASVVPVWARPQAPTDSSDQEVAIEQVCGGGWARSRYTYKSGEWK